jgi:hypothetical protein
MDDAIDKGLIKAIQTDWGIHLKDSVTEEQLLDVLSKKVNQLIQQDFPRLISLLYRIDVNESKLKQLLRENPTADAGILIAQLILERQNEKLKTRQLYGRREDGINDDDKW